MARFSIGEQVIVNDHGVRKLGIITGQFTKQKVRVYNVRMENGVEHNYLRADSIGSDYYIDSELSKRIASQVSTSLNINSKANFKNSENIVN